MWAAIIGMLTGNILAGFYTQNWTVAAAMIAWQLVEKRY